MNHLRAMETLSDCFDGDDFYFSNFFFLIVNLQFIMASKRKDINIGDANLFVFFFFFSLKNSFPILL